ncbi:hypothetical protein QYE76_056110 [Lolium multiflorum]|uniref:Uncharacterized protein n=1 Tax=Lolium multiflorum TaxID=4521 RepID=A0AAD8T100_LOLMU|nr:hypothetical protein QYE76_056110 [Lolium multiflorum]
MASTIGGSGSSGARRSRERGLAFGSVEQAQHPRAAKMARVSAGASRSGAVYIFILQATNPRLTKLYVCSTVSSSGKDGVLPIFRFMLTNHMMKSSRGYVRQELLTEAQRLEAVHKAVEKIIDYHQQQIPETEKSIEQYICQNEMQIKECLKRHVQLFWKESSR